MVYGHLTETDELRDAFLTAEGRASQAFILVKHLDECRAFADELIFCQQLRKQRQKTKPGGTKKTDVEKAVRDLVDSHVESEGVYDIFKAAGIERADLSILDEKFLQTFKDKPLPNLRLKLLEALLKDELTKHEMKNLAKAKSKCVVWVIGEARRYIRSTTDALKFLEYVCPEEFGATARKRAAMPATSFDLNRERCRIVTEANSRTNNV